MPDSLPALPNRSPLGLAALMRSHMEGKDLAPLYQQLLQQAGDDPDDAASLLDAGIILQFYNQPDLARQLLKEAVALSRHYRFPVRTPVRLRVLALMVPGELMANVPIECLLEDSDVELNIYYATGDEFEPSEIPDHDVLFVAVSETEANRPILAAWLPLLAMWPRPVINNPQHIAHVARDTAARLLSSQPGIAMPPTLRMGFTELQQLAGADGALRSDLAFPLLVRPLDSHAGHDLHKVDSPAELASILASLPGDEFFVAPFIDYRSADGQFRKYRIILIEGQPFACHMGISSHWMIHYLNAGMADNADKRAEEARFLANFDDEFAPRHTEALAAIHRQIGLDYLGIDCAETTDGRLLIFEVDHAMVVHAMDPVDLYPYKQAAMHTLFAAFRAMLIKAAEQAPAQVE